jgi:predicted nucleotidyltransferase
MPIVNKQSILSFLLEHKSLLQTKYKVAKIGLFGSYVNNEETKESDIDILVDMPSNFDLYYDLKEFLEDAFHKPIDLGLEKNIRSLIKEKINKEVIYV